MLINRTASPRKARTAPPRPRPVKDPGKRKRIYQTEVKKRKKLFAQCTGRSFGGQRTPVRLRLHPAPGFGGARASSSRAFQADARRPCLRRRRFQTLVGEPRRAPPRPALQFRGGGEGWDFHHDSYLCYYCLVCLNLQLSLHICPNLGEVQSEGRSARRESGFPLCRFSRDP